MRWVISSCAFLVPILLAIGIVGYLTSTSDGREAAIGRAAIDELRSFVTSRDELLTRYALPSGRPETTVIPHLALERFDLRGVDAQGNPWYRLAETSGLSAGVLHRQTPTSPIQVVGGQKPTGLIPLSRRWTYWEVVPAERPAKRP